MDLCQIKIVCSGCAVRFMPDSYIWGVVCFVAFFSESEYQVVIFCLAHYILIEIRILTAGDAFMKHIGLDPNSAGTSEDWSDHLVHASGDSTSFIVDQLHADLLLKTVAAHKDAAMLAAPQFFALNGKKSEI